MLSRTSDMLMMKLVCVSINNSRNWIFRVNPRLGEIIQIIICVYHTGLSGVNYHRQHRAGLGVTDGAAIFGKFCKGIDLLTRYGFSVLLNSSGMP